MNPKITRRAFTLIELLVVIAIIAILAAILFPVFARARASARRITGLSNLNQLGKAMLMYAQDNDEQFPHWNYGTDTCGGGNDGHSNALAKQRSPMFWLNATQPY